MKISVIVLICLFAATALAHDPIDYHHHHDTVYVIDITPEPPWEPEPISIYSNEEIQRDTERLERRVNEYNERVINQWFEDQRED